MEKIYTAIVLAAGKGTRMGTAVAKQFLELGGKPVVVHALEAFEKSPRISRIVLVTGKEQTEYCRKEIIEKYRIGKTVLVCEGGKERYLSVERALCMLKQTKEEQNAPSDYILIHDGARPFLNEEMIERICSKVENCQACVAGMPVKDTIKITNDQGIIQNSPRRDLVWQAQTPQAFAAPLLFRAFASLRQHPEKGAGITDDAMVVEQELGVRSAMVEGRYENIKITTPEDLVIAEKFLERV